MEKKRIITEKAVMNWMRNKVKKSGFNTAADLAKQFLSEQNISQVHHPDFPTVLDASFKIADEVYDFSK